MNIYKTALAGTTVALLSCSAFAEEKADDGWKVVLQPHIWLPTITADTGSSDASGVEVPTTEIESGIEAAIMLNLELRKDRWGLLTHGMYARLSADGTSPGPFFNLIDTTIELGELDLALFYRVLDGERGWLDLLAGVRYAHIGTDYEMTPDYAAIDETSSAVVNQAVSTVHGRVESTVNEVSAQVAAQVAALATGEGAAAAELLRGSNTSKASLTADDVVNYVDNRLPPGTRREAIGNKFKASLDGRVEASTRKLADAIQSAMAERVQQRTDQALAAAGPGISTSDKTQLVQGEIKSAADVHINELKQTASAQTRKALEQAEQELGQAMSDGATEVSEEDHSSSSDWVAPYAGVRGRVYMSERFYAGGRADIGGLGIGCDLVWQAFAGVGFEVSEHIELEAGWRYMSVDYDEDGLVFDATLSGALLGLGIKF